MRRNYSLTEFFLFFVLLFSIDLNIRSVSSRTSRHWYQPKNRNQSYLTTIGSHRIVGGQETTIQQFPYLVNLRRNGQFSCGGSLLTNRCVLTAAHCVYMVPVKQLSVYAGASRLNANEFHVRLVENAIVSNLYSPYTMDMDVAILQLMEPPLTPDSMIQTTRLCTHQLPKVQDNVTIVGWGVTTEGSSEPSVQLRTATVPVLSRESCQKAYRGQAQITGSMFCATVPGLIDSCSGDSGGPVVYRQGNCVCGIVSWGFGCAREEYPGVYTNIANIRVNTFIRTTLKRNCM